MSGGQEKPKKASLYMDVYLGDLKTPWVEYCASVGKKPGAALREAIEKQLAGLQVGRPKTIFTQVEETSREPKKRFEILLTVSEREALEIRAKEAGSSVRQFIVDAVRATLTHEPQYSMKEIEALGESNYQLLAIGRNLNQIARRLNEGKYESVTVERIEELSKSLRQHAKKVSDTIGANIERWNLR